MKVPLRRRLPFAFLIAGALLAARASATMAAGPDSRAWRDLMAEGKAETDLGHHGLAIRAFTAIVDAPDAPAPMRTEALVRLGAARRGAGDHGGALDAFVRASKAPGLDRETKALLVQTLGGALPGAERWAQIWGRVGFAVDRSVPDRPTLAVVWPDVVATRRYRGKPMTLRREGDLQDLFRLIADVSDLNVVVNPGVHGRFVLKVENEPWDRFLDQILSANGLAYQWEDNVLRIGLPQDLGPARRFSGERIDVDWGTDGGAPGRDLSEGLSELAAAGEATVVLAPGVAGRVVLKLNRVRWDQAFDIVVRINGLDWTRHGHTLSVFPRGGRSATVP